MLKAGVYSFVSFSVVSWIASQGDCDSTSSIFSSSWFSSDLSVVISFSSVCVFSGSSEAFFARLDIGIFDSSSCESVSSTFFLSKRRWWECLESSSVKNDSWESFLTSSEYLILSSSFFTTSKYLKIYILQN